MDGTVRLRGAGGVSGTGELLTEGQSPGSGRSLLDLRRGAAPSVDGGSHAGSALSWVASDPDGDLRRVAVKYSVSAQTPAGVLADPDDWYEADEGAAHQVFVGEGSFSDPFFAFFRDRDGTLPQPSFLVAGRSYRFERTASASAAHPFWVGDGISADFTDFAVEGTDGRSRTSGIQAPGEFLQLDVPSGYAGTVNYFCTAHGAMSRAFEVRPATPPLDGDPLVSLSGSFDTSGRSSVTAYLAAEDSAGNTSAGVVAVAIP